MAASQARAVDIGELLDKQKLNAFHLGTFLLCALIIIVDAADTGSANVAAPAILRAFPAERSVMGWVFAWGSIGVFFGSLVFGTDVPWGHCDEIAKAVAESGVFNSDELKQVDRENALRILPQYK